MIDENATGTASMLIVRLQQLIAEHGDLPVYAEDADTSWTLPIGVEVEPSTDFLPRRIEIKATYHGRPSGDLLGVGGREE